jgi:tRNA-Thr(GGU) m(6)t(6)A37 methyltransferase TsaA
MKKSINNPSTATLESYTIRPIGYVQSGYVQTEEVAHTHNGWTEDISRIYLLPKYARGLGGLKGYSHVIVLFRVHKAKEWKMPKVHYKPRHVKIFATRMPVRPNFVGLSAVELLSFSAETGEIVVKGLDALDGTPVLDVKPYIPNFDSYPKANVPDWVRDHLNSHHHCGHTHHNKNHGNKTARDKYEGKT